MYTTQYRHPLARRQNRIAFLARPDADDGGDIVLLFYAEAEDQDEEDGAAAATPCPPCPRTPRVGARNPDNPGSSLSSPLPTTTRARLCRSLAMRTSSVRSHTEPAVDSEWRKQRESLEKDVACLPETG